MNREAIFGTALVFTFATLSASAVNAENKQGVDLDPSKTLDTNNVLQNQIEIPTPVPGETPVITPQSAIETLIEQESSNASIFSYEHTISSIDAEIGNSPVEASALKNQVEATYATWMDLLNQQGWISQENASFMLQLSTHVDGRSFLIPQIRVITPEGLTNPYTGAFVGSGSLAFPYCPDPNECSNPYTDWDLAVMPTDAQESIFVVPVETTAGVQALVTNINVETGEVTGLVRNETGVEEVSALQAQILANPSLRVWNVDEQGNKTEVIGYVQLGERLDINGMRVLSDGGFYYQIELPNGEVGFIRKNDENTTYVAEGLRDHLFKLPVIEITDPRILASLRGEEFVEPSTDITIQVESIQFNFAQGDGGFIPLGRNLHEVNTPYANHVYNEMIPYYQNLVDTPVTLNSGILVRNENGRFYDVDEKGVFITIGFPSPQDQITDGQITIIDRQKVYIGSPSSLIRMNGEYFSQEELNGFFEDFDNTGEYYQASYASVQGLMDVNNGGSNWEQVNIGTEIWAGSLIVGSEEYNLENNGTYFYHD